MVVEVVVVGDCSNNSYCYYYKIANDEVVVAVALTLTYMLLFLLVLRLAVFEALHYLMQSPHNKADTKKYSTVADWHGLSCD